MRASEEDQSSAARTQSGRERERNESLSLTERGRRRFDLTSGQWSTLHEYEGRPAKKVTHWLRESKGHREKKKAAWHLP